MLFSLLDPCDDVCRLGESLLFEFAQKDTFLSSLINFLLVFSFVFTCLDR